MKRIDENAIPPVELPANTHSDAAAVAITTLNIISFASHGHSLQLRSAVVLQRWLEIGSETSQQVMFCLLPALVFDWIVPNVSGMPIGNIPTRTT